MEINEEGQTIQANDLTLTELKLSMDLGLEDRLKYLGTFHHVLIARLSYPGGFPWSRCGYKVKYSTLAASKILPPVELRSTEVPNNTYSTLL